MGKILRPAFAHPFGQFRQFFAGIAPVGEPHLDVRIRLARRPELARRLVRRQTQDIRRGLGDAKAERAKPSRKVSCASIAYRVELAKNAES